MTDNHKNRYHFYSSSNLFFWFFHCVDATLSAGKTMLSSVATYFEPETAPMSPNWNAEVVDSNERQIMMNA